MRQYVLSIFGLLCLLSTLVGCDANKKPAAEVCQPSCSDRCEGDDGCGGECRCDVAPDECKATCLATERCVGKQCVCEPQCNGRQCLADGCGNTCPCPDGYVQNAQGDWVPEAECSDTCKTAGFSCGRVCGKDCGACSDGATCNLGVCGCVPKCDGSRCDDGCGGTCACAAGNVCNPAGACVPPAACTETCASETAQCGSVCGKPCGTCDGTASCIDGTCAPGVSCEQCSIQLRVLDRKVVSGRLSEVTIAVEYAPGPEAARPRLADLRIKADPGVILLDASAGDALLAVQKDLYRDPKTGQRFRAHGDGSYQLMAFAVGNTQSIEAGRLATLRFSVSKPGAATFNLARRHETLAPPLADSILQNSEYDRSLVVTP